MSNISLGVFLWLSLRSSLGLIFLLSLFTKLHDYQGFRVGVEEYGIVTGRGASLYALAVVVSELFLVLSHLSGFLSLLGIALSIVLLSTFLFAVTNTVFKRRHIRCHCFGKSEYVSVYSMYRLIALLSAECGLVLTAVTADRELSVASLDLVSAPEFLISLQGASAILIASIWLTSLTDLRLLLYSALAVNHLRPRSSNVLD